MKPTLLLVGGGGHCRACIDVLEQEGKFEIAGIVERLGGPTEPVFCYTVLGTDGDLPQLCERYEYSLVTVGQIKSAEPRKQLFEQLKKLGFTLPVVISSQAYVSPHIQIGSGTIIMHDVLVNAGSQIGHNCIINNKSLVEHGVRIGDHCHIATGCILNGDVEVGQQTFIGSGSVVREGIKIGQQSFIAAGTKVMKDLPPNSDYRNPL